MPSEEVLTQPCWLQVRTGRETSTRRRLTLGRDRKHIIADKPAFRNIPGSLGVIEVEDPSTTSKSRRKTKKNKNPYGASLTADPSTRRRLTLGRDRKHIIADKPAFRNIP